VVNDLGRLLAQPRPSRTTSADLIPSVVTRSDSTGVWVTPIGGDTSSPLGPCTARPVIKLTGDLQSGYQLVNEQLPVGTKCLAVNTSEGPYVVSP
jgi:hypothetical protein